MTNQARRAHKLTLRQLGEQVTKNDHTPISLQYFNDIELPDNVATSNILWELARDLELDYDYLLV